MVQTTIRTRRPGEAQCMLIINHGGVPGGKIRLAVAEIEMGGDLLGRVPTFYLRGAFWCDLLFNGRAP